MVIRLRDGRVLTGRRFGQRGLIQEPLSAAEHAGKLRDCLAGTALESKGDAVAAALERLDGPGRIDALLRILTPGASPGLVRAVVQYNMGPFNSP